MSILSGESEERKALILCRCSAGILSLHISLNVKINAVEVLVFVFVLFCLQFMMPKITSLITGVYS